MYSSGGLKKRQPEISYTLAELFYKCLKESYFPDCWEISSVVPVFKNVGERSIAKNYRRPVSRLSMVSKVLGKHVNNRIVNHLKNFEHFLISSMVLGLLDQLQRFLQFYLVELIGLSTGLGLQHLT